MTSQAGGNTCAFVHERCLFCSWEVVVLPVRSRASVYECCCFCSGILIHLIILYRAMPVPSMVGLAGWLLVGIAVMLWFKFLIHSGQISYTLWLGFRNI